jgi:hypothetical protein
MQAIRAAQKSDHDMLGEEPESSAVATSETLERSDAPPSIATGEVPIAFESDSFGLPTPRVTPALRAALLHREGDAESASILALSDTAPRPIVRLEPESNETYPAASPAAVVGPDAFQVESAVRARRSSRAPESVEEPSGASPAVGRRPTGRGAVVAFAVLAAVLATAGCWVLARL